MLSKKQNIRVAFRRKQALFFLIAVSVIIFPVVCLAADDESPAVEPAPQSVISPEEENSASEAVSQPAALAEVEKPAGEVSPQPVALTGEAEPVSEPIPQPVVLAREEKPASKPVPQPITLNGDTVEFDAASNEATATGNVEIIFKDTKLTCQKLVVNTQTKECRGEGNVRLAEKQGMIEGQRITYNFTTKAGIIYDAKFMSNPFFGKTEKMEKVSGEEFVARRSYVSTCSFDIPHYKLLTKRVNFFPGKKVNLTDTTMYVGKIPVLYMPEYNHNFNDPWMRLPISPGTSKEWGAYVLSAYRYNLNKNVKGLLLLDYRSKLGTAGGFITNFDTQSFGKGDFKFYYTREKAQDDIRSDGTKNFQRYLARFRYKWDIDERTNIVSEYYHISDKKRKYDGDSDFLRDYFQKEYEKDEEPLTYALMHRSFDYSSLDLLMQVRNNHWFDQQSKMPELKYTMPNVRMGNSKFYFYNTTTSGVYNIKAASGVGDTTVSRFDMVNKFSHPLKVSIFEFNPYVGSQETIYDKGTNGRSHVVRTMFMSGADLSTKFYRVYNVKSNFLGLNINALRHIITPTFGYVYNHTPTVPAANLKQIDSIDSLTGSNYVAIGLQNKLQTKRNGDSVDLVDFLVTTNYDFKPKTGEHGSSFRDFYFQLKVLPFSWMRLESTANY
ncbi:MAG: LptA/OstA family protein, partial [Candidatus Omnitrophota bacterium]